MLWRMVSRLDIAMTPAEAAVLPAADAYVVIDAVRATTTMAVLFHRGLARMRVVESPEAALLARKEAHVLLMGEVGGLRPEGFDLGNSPAEASTVHAIGREAILSTSNGTRAICAVAGLGPTFAGAFVNLSTVVDKVSASERVTFVCAGNALARMFSLEDFAVAAAYVDELRQRFPKAVCGDGALLGVELRDPVAAVLSSEHAEVVRSLGFGADLSLVCQRDAAPSAPFVVESGDGWAVLEPR